MRIRTLIGVVVLVSCCGADPHPSTAAGQAAHTEEEFARQREMLVRLLAAEGIADPAVLDAMRRTPRHRFVPQEVRAAAYENRPLPIGEGQTISQPFVVAFMTEALQVEREMTVLEVGTGSGYQAAVLAELGVQVYTIEIVESLGKRAERDLHQLGYDTVHVRIGDGYRGWPEHAPFDRIIVTAAPDHVPQPLVDQLAVGGRMIIPVGEFFQDLILITKDEAGIQSERVLPVRFVPMTGEAEDADR